jgi:hypothetical protein
MKQKTRTRNYRLLIAAVFLLSFFIMQQSCTKIDTDKPHLNDPTEKFFTVPAGTKPQVLRVMENLKEQNKLTGFIKDIVKKEGYALWNKAMVNTKPVSSQSLLNNLQSPVDTFIHIPLVLEGTEYVNSFILAKLNGTMTLQLFRGRDYASFGFGDINADTANAEKLALQIMVMTKEIFGHDKYILKDSRLFNTHHGHLPAHAVEDRKFKVSFNQSGSSLWFSDDVTTCTYILEQECPYTICSGPGGSCDNCVLCVGGDYSCTTSTIWYFIPDVTEGGGGGSGGGVDPNGPYECNPTPLIANGLPPCPRGNDTGWVPDLDTYNPDQADIVIVDTSVSNNFPCVQKILDTLSDFGFNNLNKKAQIALSTIFGENTYQHITIKADPTMPAIRDADTKFDSSYTVGSDLDHLHYNFTIRLNPQMLNRSTKEYIAATLTHEAMHAYIDYLFKQYQFGLIDSNYIKNKFPIFWYGFPHANPLPSEITHHNFMANNWVTAIENSLNLFTNNEMTQAEKDNVYRALSWEGLEKDSYVYQTLSLPDKFNIAAINAAARDRFQTGPYTVTLLTGEISPVFNFTASSLKLKNPCD